MKPPPASFLTQAVKPGRRRPQPEDQVAFQQLLPLKLRDFVSGKNQQEGKPPCLQEMSILLACFKANEFDQSVCSNEISNFKGCFDIYLKNKLVNQEDEKNKQIASAKNKLSHKQITSLLKKFPNQ